MSDTRPIPIRDLLERALPDQAPPTTLGRDTLLAAGRRARARRNTRLTGCAVAAVVLLATGTLGLVRYLPGAPGQQSRSGAAGHAASVSVRPSGSADPDGRPSPSSAALPSPSHADRTSDRLSRALRLQIGHELTVATFRVETGEGHLSEVPAFTFVPRGRSAYRAGATVRTRTSVGNVDVEVARDSTTAPGCRRVGHTLDGYLLFHEQCTYRDVPNGRVYIDTVTYRGSPTQYRVSALRSDRTTVWASSADFDRAGDSSALPAPVPGSAGPVLSLEQTIAIVLNPDLHL